MAPYRLQIYLDPEVREALRAVAFAQHTSLQALVTQWLVERLQRLPEGAALTTLTKPAEEERSS